MSRFFTLIFLLLPFYGLSQTNLKKIRTKSWQTYAYKISALEAEQYHKWDSVPINRFENETPVRVFHADSVDEDKLPIGYYVLITVKENTVEAEMIGLSNLVVLDINNKKRLQIDVRTKAGEFINNAKVFINNKEATYHADAKTYWAKQKKCDEGFVKVYSPGDTLFVTLALKDREEQKLSQQRKRNYHSRKVYKYLSWLPRKIKSFFNTYRNNYNRIGASGYIIFNQPKYKPLDTVKFKGYVVDKKWKQYKKGISIYLNYYDKGQYYNQLIKTLSPVTPGAYVAEFVVADSIPMDINCTLYFKTADKKEIIRETFKTEDYLLDEIGVYNFKAGKEIYFRNDSIRFFASAKDANGLNVMDTKARLILTTQTINAIYQDTLFVTDTIYNNEIKLLSNSDTRFIIPANSLPKADLKINAKLIFKNSNNELHEENESFDYKYLSKEIIATQNADSIKAVYVENGIEVEKDGKMEINDDTAIVIRFPYLFKIDPIAKDYSFYTKEKNSKEVVFESIDVEENYRLSLSRISSGDTLGFILGNPYKIPVYFTVFNGNKIIAAEKQNSETVIWKKIIKNHRQAYKVRWQYIWAGRERQGEENIGLLYKLLNIKINTGESVFPGQKDAVQIDIKDYKGRPAADVNLTAVSYNNQFNNSIRVKEPPYLARYKSKKGIVRTGFENDEGEDEFLLTKNYLLGKNKTWIDKFHLDSMIYFKLLFPQQHYYDAATPVDNFIPQISVNVVQKGIPQEIYLLYLNRQLVYYNGVTGKMNNAYEVYPENVHVAFRLKDKYVEIDSLYMQPNYKHDVSFDLDNLPPHSTITKVESYWSYTEMNLLEQTMWQMQNNYQNNNAYLWQHKKLVQLSGNREHIAGPFNTGEMTFYVPGSFDISYNFEPGYQYSLSKQMARLERKPLFPQKGLKNYLPEIKNTAFILGDTLVEHPYIFYPPTAKRKFLLTNNDYSHSYYATTVSGKGTLQFTMPKDSVINYWVLEPTDTGNRRIILSANNYDKRIRNINPGIYSLLLVTNNFYVLEFKNIFIQANGTEYVKTDAVKFSKENDLINTLIAAADESVNKKYETPVIQKEVEKVYVAPDSIVYTTTGGAIINGTVTDSKGKYAISGASILLKAYNKGTSTDMQGNFTIKNLRPGKYIVQASAVGYERTEITTMVNAYDNIKLEIKLKVSNQSLNEVVVVGYGTAKRKDLTGSISVINGRELTADNVLGGKIPGVMVTAAGVAGADTKILIRGVLTLQNGNKPLYVIDGILYDDLPENFNVDNTSDVTVLKDAAATAIYGIRGTNGVIVITTNTTTFRSRFKDYALWQPNFFTDKNGHAAIEINYPDNITGWKTFVVGMDKRRRMGKAYALTQSYKPVTAELSVPQFLLEGDTAVIIGKNKNYTTDKYSVTTEFTINGQTQKIHQKELLPNDAAIEELKINSSNTDTVKAGFTLQTTTGFKDGEERKIPVFKKGTEEAVGNFWVLKNDTPVSFTALPDSRQINIYAQNNTLDVMLEELEHLRQYPYYCMEQTASKLTGLALEKKIKEQLKQPFKNEKEFDRLLQKIQKAQQFDGGWGWWENGKTNFYITSYIANALLKFRENPLVETNIRNAFLYLQNQLPFLNKNELLAALTTLNNGKHEMEYSQWINKINFDSLNQHQQWQWVQVKQQQKMNYQAQLKKLLDKKINTMPGGVHWGDENYLWYSNEVATTIIAFNVLKNEAGYKDNCSAIIQYFLEKRRGGYWRNTVESATILNTILPTVLEQQTDFTKPANIIISGDTNFVVTAFPYRGIIRNSAVKNLNINKAGGGMVYFTAYQKIFNATPVAVEDKFIIRTYFEKNNETIAQLKAGETVKMILKVDVLKDADYVMLELPIPAGCTYAAKNNNGWKVYKEFYKNKVLLFAESLSKGSHQFEIELEPRYGGTYTLNPAKAELMYYPIFYGRNEMKSIEIK